MTLLRRFSGVGRGSRESARFAETAFGGFARPLARYSPSWALTSVE